jgi:ATP-binding protein involved in chromosome partitioning
MSYEAIKDLVLVASGKGGVGKSTVAVNLAVALAKQGTPTGLLDADVYGPSIPTMLGDAAVQRSADGRRLVPVERHGIKAISMGYLVDNNTAMVWRGPMLSSAVTQMIDDVEWGELDTLVFDLPPGTGDIQLTLAQKFKVTGAVLVTTPQDVALADVTRAKAMFDRVRIRTLGLIENMSYFVCPGCSERHEIFSSGGGERAARDLEIPFLGRIPIDTAVRASGDEGRPVVAAAPESESARAFSAIAGELRDRARSAREEIESQERRKRSLRVINT